MKTYSINVSIETPAQHPIYQKALVLSIFIARKALECCDYVWNSYVKQTAIFCMLPVMSRWRLAEPEVVRASYSFGKRMC